MSDTTPAATIARAAAHLRQLATTAHRASPAPWAVDDDDHVVRCADEMIVTDRSDDTDPAQWADLPYIAAMDPHVGLALADWLDQAADAAADGAAGLVVPPGEPALAVARAILGEQP